MREIYANALFCIKMSFQNLEKTDFFVLALVLRTAGRNVFRDNNEGTRAKLIINTLEIIHLVRMENFMGN